MNTDKVKKKIIEESISDDSWMDAILNDESKDHYLEYSSAIAVEILLEMKKQKINQTDLAKILGVTPQQVSKIVKGKENLTLDTIGKIERALNFKILRVIDHEKEENVNKEKNPFSENLKDVIEIVTKYFSNPIIKGEIHASEQKLIYLKRPEDRDNILSLSRDHYSKHKENTMKYINTKHMVFSSQAHLVSETIDTYKPRMIYYAKPTSSSNKNWEVFEGPVSNES